MALLSVGAFALAGCKPKAAPDAASSTSTSTSGATSLEGAVAGSWRSRQDKARDVWRHPAQSLAFWGVKPGDTVVEVWPGAGWYADIIAPFLAATGGTYYAADVQATSPAAAALTGALKQKFSANPRLYGAPHFTEFGPTSGPLAPAGSADVVLFLRNLHNWMEGGFADKAFRDAFQALKPGGVLGIEEHRATPGGLQDILAKSGYVQEAYVKQIGAEAGFTFDKASQINANPKDDHNHPFGVWTLPPTRRSAPEGKPPNPKFDHAKYDAIGESDRMTLRFVKPG